MESPENDSIRKGTPVKYLTVSANCTKKTSDLLSVEWDEGKLGEPTVEAFPQGPKGRRGLL